MLVGQTPDNFRIGLVTFADYAEQIVAPTTDRGAVEAALDRMVADGGTAMGDGLARGLQAAQTPVPTEDGRGHAPAARRSSCCSPTARTRSASTTRSQVAQQAKPRSIPIYTIALGTEGGEVIAEATRSASRRRSRSRPTRRRCARSRSTTGGRFFEAVSAKDAEQIYARIGTRLTSKPEQREVTVAFAGGAFVLLLAGGALSLVWFGRLV